MKRIGALGLALAWVSASWLHSAPVFPALIRAEFIYDRGPYPSCHASTIAQTRDGALVAAWFGGSAESHPDVCIYLSRQEGGQWTASRLVGDGVQADGRRFACWNPVLFQPRAGPLLLFYKVGPSPEAWWGMLRTSADDGRTWDEPRRLPAGILGPVKDKPIQLADGTLLCGSSTEVGGGRRWRIHLEVTSDLGTTWRLVGPLEDGGKFNCIQPTILTHPGGCLQLLCRSQEMTITTAWSEDAGATWSQVVSSGLYSVNSGIDAVTLADGRQLLVYNPRNSPRSGPPSSKAAALGGAQPNGARAHQEWGARWPLVVAISPDGIHWQQRAILEDEPRPNGYAYPAVIQTADHLVHLTYTWDRRKIKHVILDPAKL